MALRQTTVTVDNIDLDCYYYIQKDSNWNKEEVVIENIIYKGVEVSELLYEANSDFIVKLEELIYEDL